MSPALESLTASGDALSAAELVERLGLWDVEPRGDRPHVVAAMIGSLDGRATVDGHAGGLGSPADRDVLRELRTAADALLVGPGTLIAERYATILDPPQQQRRLDRGLPREPLVATISRSLDPRLAEVPLFSEPDTRIEIFTERGAELPALGANVTVTRPEPWSARRARLPAPSARRARDPARRHRGRPDAAARTLRREPGRRPGTDAGAAARRR